MSAGRTVRRCGRRRPTRGLEAFGIEHADIFFGREQEIIELESRLRSRESELPRCTFVVVVGASGSGKSSLVRAGLRSSLTRFKPRRVGFRVALRGDDARRRGRRPPSLISSPVSPSRGGLPELTRRAGFRCPNSRTVSQNHRKRPSTWRSGRC